ncbi:hypothetical protein B0T26DRAFT_877020 [Lasiosphaeria miniovina]|uniref:Uncharacterized protein n=1 Tax=Lasiosphaeria miniovina TaxID=1954250 RepID=A0AA39ZQE1_9PEZI|nr:uncharacterized protein B0T26DRAFT_877020 [Lasiosphaeria miniovina]KAK0701711.1 hypothetical protein B0T26DRAFT_877020 [Lasiosphaeria miniovina]
MGYELFAKRLLESKVVFKLGDSKVRTDAGLAKRAKAQRSTIDWHHTRKVLMHSYGQAHGFTPPKQGYFGAEEGSSRGELEEDQMSDSEELHVVDKDKSTSDKDVPELSRSLDEVEAFLKAYGRSTGTAGADSATAVSVNKAITAIMGDMHRGINTHEGVFDPASADADDVETGSGSDQDRRHVLSFEKKGRQMLRLYFESLELRTGGEILQWYAQNRDQIPRKCYRVYSVGSGWFPVDLLKAGKWPEMGRVTFDEAHTIRNLDSIFYIGARLVPAHEMLLATVNPQFNGTHDILAYASLFAARSGLDRYFDAAPGVECSAVIKGVKSSEEVVGKAYVTLQQMEDTSFIDQLHQWANKNLARPTFLSSFISLRRMKTRLRAGDRDIYPRASLPEFRVRTVKFSFQPKNENLRTMQHLASAAVKFMYTILDSTDQNDKSKSAQTKEQRTSRRKLLRDIKEALNLREGREGSIAMALHRILTLISFDMRNYRLLFDKTVFDCDPLVKLSDDEVKKLH